MDNSNTYNKKLTPSARVALEDISKEISSRIFDTALENAQLRNTAEHEISLRDIIEAKEQLLNNKKFDDNSEYKTKRFVQIISLSGAIYALGGIFLYIFKNKNFTFENDLGLIVAFLGIIIMLLSYSYAQLLTKFSPKTLSIFYKQFSSPNKTEYDIVHRWHLIEKLTGDIMIEKGIEENKARSINSIIDFLSSHLNDIENSKKLKLLLTTRNKILHEFYQPSKIEKSELMEFSNFVIDFLEKLRN